jgi:hypothetical protein
VFLASAAITIHLRHQIRSKDVAVVRAIAAA